MSLRVSEAISITLNCQKKANGKAHVTCEDQSWVRTYVQGVGPSQGSMRPRYEYLSFARHVTSTTWSMRASIYFSIKTFTSGSMCSKIALKKELHGVARTQPGYTKALFT